MVEDFRYKPIVISRRIFTIHRYFDPLPGTCRFSDELTDMGDLIALTMQLY